MNISNIYNLPKNIENHTAVLFYYNAETALNSAIEEISRSLGELVQSSSEAEKGNREFIITGCVGSRLFMIKQEDKHATPDYYRAHIFSFIRNAANSSYRKIYAILPESDKIFSGSVPNGYIIQTSVEGCIYASYQFDKYKSNAKKTEYPAVFFLIKENAGLEKVIEDTQKLMTGVFFARDLANEPANVLTPAELAKRCSTTLTSKTLSVKIFDEKEIKRRKMGGLLAVGQGSSNKPRFIVTKYNCGKKSAPTIAVVGKGVCFDSGGISIKPAQNMGMMKADMGGAAVTAGVMLAAQELKIPIDIYGIIPAAENMLSGSAMRPGDIVITSSGKSIEVDNTDAEGRMILADALHFASELKPDLIIDLATLTGASAVALGDFVTSLFAKNEALSTGMYNSGIKTHERCWPMPLWDDYATLNSSDVADVKNIGGKWGGAITAAKFLENWVAEPEKWIHLDIAGPAMPQTMTPYNKTYMSGTGVRLVIDFLYNYIKTD